MYLAVVLKTNQISNNTNQIKKIKFHHEVLTKKNIEYKHEQFTIPKLR